MRKLHMDIGTLNALILTVMKDKNMDLDTLALNAGISNRVLRRCLNATRPWHINEFVSVASCLGLSASTLLDAATSRKGEDDPHTSS